MTTQTFMEPVDTKADIVRMWYNRLQFPQEYDTAFEELLMKAGGNIHAEFSDSVTENFLSALYQCEALSEKYNCLGIDSAILDSTLSDLKIWTKVWYDFAGEVGIKESGWLKNHFSGRLFRLGRLQFCMGQAMQDIPQKGIKKGMPTIEVHIPAGEPMELEACKASIKLAKEFFQKYFPEFEYHCFTCHSWLLDKTLERFLDEKSNILAFQRLYCVVSAEESDALLSYIFGLGTVRENLEQRQARTGFAKKVKEYALSGGKFYVAYGVVDEIN